jgi:hypothetical protein
MLFFWMFLRALTRTLVAGSAGVLALRQHLAIYGRTLPRRLHASAEKTPFSELEVVSGQPGRADPRARFFRGANGHVSALERLPGCVARPPPRAGLPRAGLWRHRASDLGLDRPSADRSLSVREPASIRIARPRRHLRRRVQRAHDVPQSHVMPMLSCGCS